MGCQPLLSIPLSRTRRRKEFELSVKELFAQFNLNPVAELLKMLRERRAPMDGVYRYKGKDIQEMEKDELLEMGRALLAESWLSVDQTIEVLGRLVRIHTPDLKAVEVKGTVNNEHTIKIINFALQQNSLPPVPQERIVTVPEIPALEDGNDPAL